MTVTHWLFISGVSLDLSGAVLIAWTIYSRTEAETREEALTWFNANLWVVVFRQREQAFVRAGLILLGCGFALQFGGYLTELSFIGRIIAPPIAAVLIAGSLTIAHRLAKQALPIHYADDDELPQDVLEDERHSFRLRTLAEVIWWRRHWVTQISRKEIARTSSRVSPVVNHGRWTFSCSCAPGVMNIATPQLPTAVCLTCGREYGADFPDSIDELVRVLMLRPQENRNWTTESIDELQTENQEHGYLR